MALFAGLRGLFVMWDRETKAGEVKRGLCMFCGVCYNKLVCYVHMQEVKVWKSSGEKANCF